MKIKFYPLKRNGEIAKTPIYTDSLDKQFCCYNLLNIDGEHYRYSYSQNKSLYEVYLEILRGNVLDLSKQMFVEKTPISFEDIKNALEAKTTYFANSNITPKLNEYQSLMDGLCRLHKENVNDIRYCAFAMKNNIDEYKKLNKHVQCLQNNKLVYLKNEDEDREGYQVWVDIIDDIKPITPEELLFNI
jgi:negative regulator of replication initiation